ncbi:right-handed parallel beta-helix repeat-containing protein [Cellulomonas fimi]|uniref:Uncharacterized protein n=1 Tax=Cellulomonas fimi (strain ATCC 484 / DSM 20113 / JCM 1341 / CCUG 24087 / LMG 16345 / NBRC 15513 / NCIMB 8980 / NCTC 7547 / NRS-133) TaxID=590998 RepID=F4GZ48_CELFA|nr:right-handed parallel beta-helix repeat-containing protein [Cellulomonas fimi]AEE47164.1 hypothetical protein Celf_3047 [Cellulomonas fimi ATCC 484]NNH07699.1 hypothetical protein [Cellulomonas fimi]VEH35456.1 Uncharacterised protein [Cellulomonas fimi]
MSSARPHAARTGRRTALAAVVGALSAGLVGLAAPAQASTAADYTTSAESLAATAVAPTEVATDAFARQVTGGWGSATKGGAWTATGGEAADFAVASGVASMKVRQPGWQLFSSLPAVRSTDTDLRAAVSLDKAPTGGSVDADVVGRAVDTTAGYRLRNKILADGNVRSSLVSVSGGVTTTLGAVTQSGLGFTAGKQLQVRLQVTGTAPTSLKAKIWTAGTAEPADWQVVATDSTAALQVAGGIAFGGYTSSSVTNAPLTARVADVRATGTQAPVPAPVVPGAVGTYVPDSTTTGVPNGTKLTVHQGDLLVTTPGAVIDGLDVRGFVKVAAANVTIKNSIIRGAATSKQTALVTSASSTASVTVIDSELYNSAPGPWVDGVRGYNFKLVRVNLHDVIDMAHIYGDNVTIEASYLHDNLHYDVDPAQNNTPSHDDSIQIQKGNNIRIVGNSISGAYNTGIQFTQDQGLVSNVTVQKNFLDGGGCTVNLAEKGKGPFQGIAVKDNTFGRTTKHYNCAIISPVTTVIANSGNYFTDGVVATVRKG